ncbi:hypothetical protein BGX20_006203, partial [Mortierella sp. AD010]
MAEILAAINSVKMEQEKFHGRMGALEKDHRQLRSRQREFSQWRESREVVTDDEESAEVTSSSSTGQRRPVAAPRWRNESTNPRQERNGINQMERDKSSASRGFMDCDYPSRDPPDQEPYGRVQSTSAWNQRVAEANKKYFTRKKFDHETHNAEEWVEYFRGYLHSHIRDLPKELQNKSRKSPCSKLLDEFEEYYTLTHIKQQSNTLEGIRTCKQKDDEPTGAYLIRFQRLVDRYRKTMASSRAAVNDLQIHQALYAGVRSVEVAKRIRKVPTLERAYIDAMKTDKDNGLWSHLRTENPELTLVEAKSGKEKTDPSINRVYNEIKLSNSKGASKNTAESADPGMSALTKAVNDLRIMIGQQQPQGGAPRAPGAPRTAPRRDIKDVTCLNYGESGHYKSNCTAPIRDSKLYPSIRDPI